MPRVWLASLVVVLVVAAVVVGYVDRLQARIATLEAPFGSLVVPMRESVVRISVLKLDGTQTMGTGFYIDRAGAVMTASHLVENAGLVASSDIHGVHRVYHLTDLRSGGRVAVLRPQTPFTSPRLMFADSVEMGETVTALGWPDSLAGDIGLVTRGYVAGTNASLDMLVLDLPSSHGASGSPVVNRDSKVVGVLKLSGSEGDDFTYAVDVTDG